LPADFAIALHGRWLGALTLRVLDDDGKDLDGVELLVEDGRRRGRHHVLDEQPSRCVLAEGTSPVQFLPGVQAAAAKYRVRARGHAWRDLELSHLDRAPHEVRLTRGGDLEVRCVGAPVPTDSVLRVHAVTEKRSGRTAIVREVGWYGEAVTLAGMVPGRYDVRLEKGQWFADPIVVAAARAKVVAGKVQPVTLVASTITVPPDVPVTGTLHLPGAWGKDGVDLVIKPDREVAPWCRTRHSIALANMTEIGPEEYRWDAGQLPAGGYEAILWPCGTSTRFEAEPERTTDVRVAVGPPTDVALHFFDVGSGLEVQPAHATWALGSASEDRRHSSSMERDTGGAYRFRAPAGTVSVWVMEEPFGMCAKTFELHAGQNELRFEGERSCGVAVAVFEEGRAVPWDDAWYVNLTAIEGTTGGLAYCTENRAAATTPGHYLVSVQGIDGPGTTEESVTVERGEWTKVTVYMRR
jgi:hypothetical protein